MKLLLDTHAWIWASQAPAQLGKRARAELLASRSTLSVSAVSHLEVARLAAHDRLLLTMPVRDWCARALEALAATALAIDEAVALEAYALPGAFHADPADRLLVATARVHKLVLLTADKRILRYREVRSLDARK